MDSFRYEVNKENKAVIRTYIGQYNPAVIIPSKISGAEVIELADKCFYNERKFTGSVELRRGIRYIGKFAFAKCENLKKVIIPATVEEIGDGAFSECESLEEVWFLGDMPAIGKAIFKSTMFAKIRYYETSKGWDTKTFGGLPLFPLPEDDGTFLSESDDDDSGDISEHIGMNEDGELVGGADDEKVTNRAADLDADQDAMFEYEEPRYMAEVNVYERVGVGVTTATSLKNVANPIEAFRLRLSGIFNKVVTSSGLRESDLAVMLEPISNIENIKFKNPAGYLLGYIASSKGVNLTRSGYESAIRLLPFINDGKAVIITPPDIIRYAIFWTSIKSTYFSDM